VYRAYGAQLNEVLCHGKTAKPSADLKKIYQLATEEEALLALDQLAERWDAKYL
jgi:transposase-like protein